MKKNGFTLIELLAVIIILGILMIIAIPSVTRYISDSRRSAYVDTANALISGARNLVNEGKLQMFDTDTTYYINTECIKTEGANKSPYGEFVKAYVVVTYNGKGYDYYWTSIDEVGNGVKKITNVDKLTENSIESDLKITDIIDTIGVNGRHKYMIIDKEHTNCRSGITQEASSNPNVGGTQNKVCRPATALHEVECKATYTGCYNAGYKNDNIMIKYGSIVSGSPKPGDAYDCDVNNDGTYDAETERFYYVGSEGTNAVLIYYRNINNQTPNAYDSAEENWHGPRTGYQYLPSTDDWDHPGIIAPGTRQIVASNGTTSTAGGPIGSFTYTGKAARLLTISELVNSCPSLSGTWHSTEGELDGCVWFLEKVGRFENYADENAGLYGYWLETPRYDINYSIYNIWGNKRRVYDNISDDPNLGIRPVITVLTSDLG